jgi:hypothetical protein
MEAKRSSETLGYIKPTRRHIPEDCIFHSHAVKASNPTSFIRQFHAFMKNIPWISSATLLFAVLNRLKAGVHFRGEFSFFFFFLGVHPDFL